MHLESNAGGNSAVDSCAIACNNSSSNNKHPKLAVMRDFPKHCGPFASGTNGGESEWSAHFQNIGCSKRAKYEAAIPAVPLRSAPILNGQRVSDNSLATHGNGDGAGQRLAKGKGNKFGFKEDTWKYDLEKLTALIAQAKEYMYVLSAKYSASEEVSSEESKGVDQINSSELGVLHKTSTGEPKPLMQTLGQEETAGDQILAESVTVQNLDESMSENTMKVEDSVSKVVQGRKSKLQSELEDNEEVCILSPAEWNILQTRFRCKCDDIISTGKRETHSQIWSTCEFMGDSNYMVESQGNESQDGEQSETKSVEMLRKHGSIHLDECVSLGKKRQGELLTKFAIDDSNGNMDCSIDEGKANNNDEHEYEENQKELINLSIVQHDSPQGVRVRKALKMFEEQYTELQKERNADLSLGKGTKYPHLEAAERLKAEGMCFFAEKPFGHIPGVEIGDEFRFRSELSVIGLHRQLISGIDYAVLDGRKCATSIIDSGRYENEAKALDVLIYSGQGGNPKIAEKAVDQKLEKGNLALMNSMEMGYPVRVTYKRKSLVPSNTSGMSSGGNFVYVYDGLYTVNNMWQESDQNRKLVFKFELHRMSGQPRPLQTNVKFHKQMKCMEVCMVDDISHGKESLPMRAVNGVDDGRYRSFTYITNIVYPSWYQRIDPIGCNCVNGCSDSQQCPCVLKNGGEIPFNGKGDIIRARPIVHECGPSCKCPPSCMNRVSQHGIHYQLEIFKTTARGWGVRSRNDISSGSFICEYVGELLQDNEAEQRIDNDEYLFDISCGRDGGDHGDFEGFLGSKSNDDGFSIDAAKSGNIGRFINHSCSPNLYAQKVLFDHNDVRMPHIMFFATDNIPSLRELTYDYNYTMDRVCDVNGNIKTKDCCCGSRKCTRRMY